ncbi:hypothetical protein QSV34_05630 [Porticoccus sp. W117]|uniref:hypothetical protein n=1 Tax=Porticoccus sp. W117 TaxID=3054777 RepID=UPI0025986FD9|nr:hypothetical protein [Porticoccus sp. W117]MDM3870831.1 hypothetical protein [Porticoccus sp. W117]
MQANHAIKNALSFLLLPLLAPFALLVRLFRGGVDKSIEEVEAVLQRMLSGKIDAYWWDDFLSTPIRDRQLNAIRERCDEVWHEQSPYISKDIDGQYYLNSDGISEIQALLQKCSYLKASRAT